MKRKPFNHKLCEDDHSLIKKLLAEQTPLYIIAKKIGCDRHILSDYIKAHDELLTAQNDREEAFKDTVEYELRRKIVVEKNLNAMMFYADRKMRDRGYGEHIENEQTGGLEGAVVFGQIPESELPPENAGNAQPLKDLQVPAEIPDSELPPEQDGAQNNNTPKGMF